MDWKKITLIMLILSIVITSSLFIGFYNCKNTHIDPTAECFSFILELNFTCRVEIIETPSINSTSTDLIYFDRIFLSNITEEHEEEYLTTVSGYLLVNGKPKTLLVHYGIGLIYDGYNRPITINNEIIEHTRNSIALYRIFYDPNLRYRNCSLPLINYIYVNISVNIP